MANLDKYLNDAQMLLDTLRIQYRSVGVECHESIAKLRQKKEYDPFFTKAVQYDLFRTAFGWNIARFNDHFFMVKKTAKHTIFIEAKLESDKGEMSND